MRSSRMKLSLMSGREIPEGTSGEVPLSIGTPCPAATLKNVRRLCVVLCVILASGPLPVGTSAQAQIVATRTAVVALAHEPDRFYQPGTTAGQLVANLVFDPLVELDVKMNPYPVLAASLPSGDNGLVHLSGDGADRRLIVTMPLRQDVTWSDGEPFTAADVVYTWQLM